MSIREFIFRNKKLTKKSEITQNPFVKGAEGRAEWNDRYMNMSKMIRYWKIAFFASISVIFSLTFVVGKMATESHVQPFVVETNNGVPIALKSLKAISPHDKSIINYAINQFIINARTIITDSDAEKALLDKLYAYTANNAINFLHDYYEKNNPFELAGKYSVTVNIIHSLPLSNDTWQVTWDETKRSANGGNVIETSRWVANLTYKLGEVNSN